jgi:hypothetical protein
MSERIPGQPACPPMPPKPPARIGTLAMLMTQLAKQGKYCLLCPDGTCHISNEPLELAARAHIAKERAT